MSRDDSAGEFSVSFELRAVPNYVLSSVPLMERTNVKQPETGVPVSTA